ncbi:MAG: c-type cytochrome [Proteobacteria bacterium]|nr:c-type cytochrome [Pseudomonadota bacterium]
MVVAPASAADTAAEVATSLGASIYLRGTTAAATPVEASRSDGQTVQGAAAACVNCHQRSGLGGREGRSYIPPITGRYLFRSVSQSGRDPDFAYVEGMRPDRAPYTDETLARAIREGLDAQGKPLSYLMPRYALGDAELAALTDYLKQLDARHVPGITSTTLHLATIITPDADPAKRRGMLDVMQRFISARNVRKLGPAPRIMGSGKSVYAKTPEMANRRWELHVWELTGPPSDWERQLDRFMAAQPVYAVLSGLGGGHWAPVHAFCERAAVPCLFPNVEAPIDQQRDFYPLYFTRGVLLEADLVAAAILRGAGGPQAPSVRQLYRAGESGEAAAAALAAALGARGLAVSSRALARGESPAAVLAAEPPADVLVLWLHHADLAAIGHARAPSGPVYVSGLLGGLEDAPLPAEWRAHAHLAYPFDLPDRRRVRVDFTLGWFRMTKIPVVDLQVQADTHLACGLLSETLSHMVDTLGRDYLIERLQMMLERRIVTGYYPRLALAAGQRFASKGGYLVRWAGPTGRGVIAESDWTVP